MASASYTISSDVHDLLARGVDELKNDHDNGARALATKAVQVLADVLSSDELYFDNAAGLWSYLQDAGRQLREARPSMGAAIGAAVVKALAGVRNKLEEDFGRDWMSAQGSEARRIQEATLSSLLKARETREKQVMVLGDALVNWLELTYNAKIKPTIKILSLSKSGSIYIGLQHAVKSLDNFRFDIRILESRPRFEGSALAIDLGHVLQHEIHEGRVSIVVGPDSHVAKFAQDVDVVLLGADRVSEDGDVSNKIGSLPAVLCAKDLSPAAKIAVVFETDKIAPPGSIDEHKAEEQSGNEVSDTWKTTGVFHNYSEDAIQIQNIYFEWVDARYFDAYVCEEGVFKREQIKAYSQKITEETDILNT